MHQAALVEYGRAALRGHRLGAALLLLGLGVAGLGAPALLPWAVAAVLGAPLVLLAALALFSLPGLALLRLLHPPPLPLGEGLALAAGLSCAALPLLLLGSEPIGLRWSPALCWLFLACCALVAAWPRHRQQVERPGSPREATSDRSYTPLLILVTLLALAVRLFAVRERVAGAFGDSYHHTIITQLLVDHGGLFRSWEPYAPLATFTYHYGFHTMAAWLHWLSGYPVALAVVAVGQIEGALAAPLLAVLATRLFGSPRVGLWTAVVVGFLSVFPAYYVNWGRYTQLAGQTVLPVACVAWAALLDRAAAPTTTWRSLLRPGGLVVVATAGVALNHYRIGIFAVCFVAVYGVATLFASVRGWPALVRVAGSGALAGLAALLLTLPWLLRLREGALLRLAGAFLSSDAGDSINGLPPTVLAQALAVGLLPLATIGLCAALFRRRWKSLLLVAWAGVVWLAANPQLLGLRGAGIISSFAVLLAAYLLLAPLVGYGLAAIGDGLAWLIRQVEDRKRSTAPPNSRFGAQRSSLRGSAALAGNLAQLIAGALIVAWGLGAQQRVVDPAFALFTPADAAAMSWIRAAAPADARFFVNSFPAYGGTMYAGSDGGWWLPLFTGRSSNLDPISYGFEAAERPDYYREVIARNSAVLRYPLDTPAAAQALKAGGYTYLYDGPMANPATEPIDPVRLAGSTLYEQVYSRDGVFIWRVR